MRRCVKRQAVTLAAMALLGLLVPAFVLADEPGQKPPPTIGEIIVTGNKVMAANAIIALSGHRVGDPCTTATLLDMRQRLTVTGNFGMHHPDHPERWIEITNEEKPSGSGKCTLTITVDENDKITQVQITGSGPIKPQEVEKRVKLGAVYNDTDVLRDTQDIQDLYNKQGYSISFSPDLGIDKDHVGVLRIPIIVTRVAEITIDGPEKEKVLILRSLKTKVGDYYNKLIWQKDMAQLQSLRKYKSVITSEEVVGPGKFRLTLHVEKASSDNR